VALSLYACANCGFWQRWFAAPPDCPVCTDPRNALPEDGWRFLPAREVAERSTGRWTRLAPDLVAFNTDPPLGLNGTGWLLLRPEGNVAFEAAPFYTDAMLDEIGRLGGIAVLAASHAHGYGALWQLQEAFAPQLAIHTGDLALTKAFDVTWPYDEATEIGPGLTLHPVGGHYAGQAALHDAGGRRLFCGDMFKVDQDADGRAVALSAHKAFHKDIPLTPRELRRYREVIAPLAFDAVLTSFEHAPDVGRDLCLAALDAWIAQPPRVRRHPVPMSANGEAA